MKCALNMNNQEIYYQCSDAIQSKHSKAEEAMKTEMLNYEVISLIWRELTCKNCKNVQKMIKSAYSTPKIKWEKNYTVFFKSFI